MPRPRHRGRDSGRAPLSMRGGSAWRARSAGPRTAVSRRAPRVLLAAGRMMWRCTAGPPACCGCVVVRASQPSRLERISNVLRLLPGRRPAGRTAGAGPIHLVGSTSSPMLARQKLHLVSGSRTCRCRCWPYQSHYVTCIACITT